MTSAQYFSSVSFSDGSVVVVSVAESTEGVSMGRMSTGVSNSLSTWLVFVPVSTANY